MTIDFFFFLQKPDERGVREGNPHFLRRAAGRLRSFVTVHDVAARALELLQALKHFSQSELSSYIAGLCSAVRSGLEKTALDWLLLIRWTSSAA